MNRFEKRLKATGYTPAEALEVLGAAARAGVSADDLTRALLALAGRNDKPSAAPLSARDASFLVEHGGDAVRLGIGGAQPSAAQRLVCALKPSPGDLAVADAAALLGASNAAVRLRINKGSLYAYQSGDRVYLPLWQFHGGRTLPHLHRVLHALPGEAEPITVAGFMTTPSDELDGQSPIAWLAGGHEPERVVFAMTSLEAW